MESRNRTLTAGTATPSRRVMLRAFAARDARYEGIFFTAVKTTGIFCRPTCPAKKPRAGNVEFFTTPREALFAGFRPCKRCRPLQPAGAAPDWLAPVLGAVDREPERRFRDRDLRSLGVDPVRVRRWFTRELGMTFQAYSRARRLGGAFRELKVGAPLDDVALGHGFESHSGFRSAFGRLFGVPPGRARTGSALVVGWIESPLGPLLAGVVDEGVCLLEFTERRMLEAQARRLERLVPRPVIPGRHALLDRLQDELGRWFAGELTEFTLPLHAPGSDFEQRVWTELRRVPYGTTTTYAELARAIGRPSAARAVGRANGRNRIAILIPCHRVVNHDGSLGGYGGGAWRKRRLLELEAGVLTRAASNPRAGAM